MNKLKRFQAAVSELLSTVEFTIFRLFLLFLFVREMWRYVSH